MTEIASLKVYYAVFLFLVQGLPVVIIPPPKGNSWRSSLECEAFINREIAPFTSFLDHHSEIKESEVTAFCVEKDLNKRDINFNDTK